MNHGTVPAHLNALVGAPPLVRLERWKAASDAERFEWYYQLLDVVASYAWAVDNVDRMLNVGLSHLSADQIADARALHARTATIAE